MEKPHPITLDHLFFTRTVVIAIKEHEPNNEPMLKHLPENMINVQAMDEPKGQYMATMRTVLNPDRDVADPYFIDMECIGFFDAASELDEDEAHRGVTITAHSVLYGAIRESISWITGRQPYGNLTLGLSVLRPKKKPAEEEPPSE